MHFQALIHKNKRWHTHPQREWIWKRAQRTLRLAPAASYLIVLHVTMETGAAAAWQTSSASVLFYLCMRVYVRRVWGGVFCEEGIVTCTSNILLDWETGLCLLTSVTWPESWLKPRPPMCHNERFSLVQNKQTELEFCRCSTGETRFGGVHREWETFDYKLDRLDITRLHNSLCCICVRVCDVWSPGWGNHGRPHCAIWPMAYPAWL